MNRISSRIGVIATVASLSALAFALTASAALGAQPIGKNGVIFSCFKAKGKNKGALRVVPSKRSCRKMRGWRPLSWSANGSSSAGQAGSQGAHGPQGPQGQQGNTGPEGKEGQQGAASQVEKTLTETVQSQATQITALTAEVTDLEGDLSELTGDLGDLEGTVGGLSGDLTGLEGTVGGLTGGLADMEGTVGDTCDQLELLTDQSDEILDSLLGSSVAVLGNLLNVPSPPDPLGTFECS